MKELQTTFHTQKGGGVPHVTLELLGYRPLLSHLDLGDALRTGWP